MLSLLKLPIRGLFLRSRVARRVFLLFLLSALLPSLLLAGLAYVQMRTMDREQVQRQLALEGGSYASSLYERLLGAHFMLGVQAAGLRQGISLPPAVDGPVARVFSRLEQHVQPLEAESWVTPDVLAHLARGESLLRMPGQGRGLQIYTAVDPVRPEQGWLQAELQPGYLWDEAEERAHQTQACVLDAQGQALHCSDRSLMPRVAGLLVQGGRPDGAAGDWQYHTRELFLRARFAADDWSVVVLRPAGLSEPGWGWLVYLFLGVVLLTLLLVALLSGVQLRRTLVPLERLIEGTRRIAREDFKQPVTVHNDDEFGELGHALNKMAARLGRQMGTLRALAEIDHDILTRVDMEQVIARVQERLHELWPQAVSSMVVFDQQQSADFGIVHLHAGEGDIRAKMPSRLEPWLLDRLARDYDGMWFDVGGGELPDFLSMVADAGAQRILVLPIFWREQISGLLAIGLMTPRDFSNELVQQARDLVNRIGVALAAQAREEQLKFRAYHDALTGLPNRSLLLERMAQELAHARRSNKQLAVLYIDLDRFKKINDSLGHEAGDRLLCQVAERLSACTREGDTVSRLSGDEFVVLLPGLTHPQQAARLAGEMQGLLGEPFLIDGSSSYVGASVGVAIFPDDGSLPAELLKKADMAMYRAKSTGRSRIIFFEESMNLIQHERAVLERELRLALVRGQLSLRYQPRIRLSDGRPAGAEALLRWQHPELGAVGPDRFIPLAEDTGLIDEIGGWVLREVCAQLGRWQTAGYRITVSVNVSGRQLRSERLVQQVQQALLEGVVAPGGLELEITEGTLIEHIESVGEQLAQVRRSGVRVALDDFGTGYSSLSHLQQLPIDILKIDRSFTRGLGRDDGAGSIVHSIIALAHALGKTVVAEGVENERQAELLRIWQCEQAQGHYYSEPLSADEFEAFLTPSRPAEIF
jgi:diguanylate cyclase (GGDEF)-like protein